MRYKGRDGYKILVQDTDYRQDMKNEDRLVRVFVIYNRKTFNNTYIEIFKMSYKPIFIALLQL